MADKPTGLQKANQKKKNIKFAKRFPQKLAAGKRMSKIKAAHQAMANPEATQAVSQAVESKLARAKNVHERITGRSTSPGFKNDPQNTGLSVESKPKSQTQSIQEKQEAKLSERVKSYRKEANKPKKMSLPTIKKGRGEGEIAPVKRGASYGSVKQPFLPSKPKKMSLPTVLQGSGKGAMAPIRQGKSYGTVKEAAPNSPHVVNPVSSEIKNLTQSAKSFPGIKVDSESIKNKQAHEKLASGMNQAGKLKNPYSGRTAVGSKYKHEQGIKESASRKNESDYNKALEDAQKGATIKKDLNALKGFVKKAQSTSRANKITEDNKSRSKEELVNPYSGRTKEKSFLKHTQATGKEIPKGSKRYSAKNADSETIDFGTPKVVSASPSSGSKAPSPPSQNAPRPKAPPIPSGLKAPPIPAKIKAPVPPSSKTKQAPLPKTNTASSQPKNYTQPSKPKAATAPPAPKPTQASDRKPSMAGGIAKAAATHIGMALMHGTNYPRVMAQHAAQGPREFKPGWHGFTSPVERPKAEEGTDTKGERG
jgi:hypothetical protein